ncbi:MAG: hypothetical protein DU429_04220 [Candidatus Tokpelaia sp.]|nr:MAG: hypothetical protein DU430_06155 [Candidatus Tokpelaia sp.]KAA6207055.1 MAG: hypothetical protein DU429_04220 [Candidatus Tokpelaia sp.]KAA6405405.1 hypothetical protein DPQ22_04920 [Candidatus Tokpelaia sp.]
MWGVAAVLVIGVLAIEALLERRAAYARAYVKASEEFYAAAQALIHKSAVSDAMIDFVTFMNGIMADKRTAKAMYYVVRNNASSLANDGKEPDWEKFIGDKTITAEERWLIISLLRKTVGVWFTAILNRSPFYGRLLLLKMAECLADNGAVEPVLRVSRHWQCSHGRKRSGHAMAA